MPIAKLDRALFRLSGDGVADWLDGLITNSLQGDLTFAGLLTPQGKIIADFFVWKEGDDLVIDTPAKFGEALFKRLKMYRLRAPIVIEDVSESLWVYAAWDTDTGTEDPRIAGLRRLKSDTPVEATASEADWNSHRLSLGLPDSQWDFGASETFPHNVNMDQLNGINFKKGCFVGQEVVSRMERKTDIRKRLCGFTFEGELGGAQIAKSERVVGDVFYAHNGQGMAMMRLDRLEKSTGQPKIGDIAIKILLTRIR